MWAQSRLGDKGGYDVSGKETPFKVPAGKPDGISLTCPLRSEAEGGE